MSRQKEKGGRDYQRDLKRTLNGCIIDAVIWGVITLLFLCVGLASVFIDFPEAFDRYRMSIQLLCFTAALAVGVKGLQSLSEITSIKDVIQRSVYAVMLTQKQQNRIFRSVSRQSFVEHLTYFLFGAVPVTAIMFVLYHNTGDTSSLLVMGILDGLLLFGTLLAYGLDVGRLASQDGFCTVSDRGIITANEILPFSAKDGDVLKMLSFDDSYEVVFRRKCYLGIPRKYTFPLPKDGALSKASDGESVEKVLLATFGLVDAVEEDGAYQETKGEKLAEMDEEVVSAELVNNDAISSEDGDDYVKEDIEPTGEKSEMPSNEESVRESALAEVEESIYVKPYETVSMPVIDAEPDLETVAEEKEFDEAVIEEERTITEASDISGNVEDELQNAEDGVSEPVLIDDDQDESESTADNKKSSVKNKLKEALSAVQAGWVRKAAIIMAVVLILAVASTMLYKNAGKPDEGLIPDNQKQGQNNPEEVDPDGSSGNKSDDLFVDVLPKSDLQQDDDGVWYATIGGVKVVLVNKEHPVPENYGGVDQIAVNTLNDMIAAAAKDGVQIVFVSGYRSYALQSELYAGKVAQVGEAAASYLVAPPGMSEYQTGLAFDVDDATTEDTLLNINFENTDAFRWLADHCAEYGFILRCPKDSTEITGFDYEPWHYRYVGVEAAKEIVSSGVTLEEYLGVYPKGN